MCLAVPGQVKEIKGDEAEVDFGGVNRKANISLVDVEVGDYIIVHAGYAIQQLEEEDALKSLEAWDEIIEITSKLEDA